MDLVSQSSRIVDTSVRNRMFHAFPGGNLLQNAICSKHSSNFKPQGAGSIYERGSGFPKQQNRRDIRKKSYVSCISWWESAAKCDLFETFVEFQAPVCWIKLWIWFHKAAESPRHSSEIVCFMHFLVGICCKMRFVRNIRRISSPRALDQFVDLVSQSSRIVDTFVRNHRFHAFPGGNLLQNAICSKHSSNFKLQCAGLSYGSGFPKQQNRRDIRQKSYVSCIS
jgi:hypothetical protein